MKLFTLLIAGALFTLVGCSGTGFDDTSCGKPKHHTNYGK